MPAMYDDPIVRNLKRVERRVDNLTLPETSPDLVSPLLSLPVLRGAWVASVNNAGDWYDISGLGKTLTYNGNPTFNYAGLVPYWDLDGTGDFLDRADEADLDILGTEAYVAVPGLTMGGWFWADAYTGPNDYLMSKLNSLTNNRSYAISLSAGPVAAAIVSNNGIATVSQASSITFAVSTWYFVVMRFVPSTTLDIYVNSTKDTLAAGIPASIFNSNAAFEIGSANVGTLNLDGRAALCFICAAALSDAQISSVFEQTRAAFGI